MESKVEGTTTFNDLHHTMGSKIGPMYLRWPQERQNQNFLESKVEEDKTTLNDLHHPLGASKLALSSRRYKNLQQFTPPSWLQNWPGTFALASGAPE